MYSLAEHTERRVSAVEGTARMSPDAQRVLLALFKEEEVKTGEPLRLRAIAKQALAGDADSAARALGELDLLRLLRTDTMGWHFGWLTQRGRESARDLGSAPGS